MTSFGRIINRLKMLKSFGYLIRYLLVGVVNTIVGFGLIFILMYLGINPYISNVIGYCVGVIVSFILNSKITFKAKARFYKFFITMAIAWIIQFCILNICILYGVNEYISQVVAGVIYIVVGFLLSKIVVFKV